MFVSMASRSVFSATTIRCCFHLLDLFQRKFAEVNYNRIHVLKSLTYFDDADAEPMPNMLVPLAWQDVKDFFREQTPGLLN